MGSNPFVRHALPVFISLSALGNVFAQSFAMPRVKQELAKEGILPFSRFWASDWPFNAPTGAIFLHWLVTTALILGSQVGSGSQTAASQVSVVYTFVTNVFIYTGNWIKRESSSSSSLFSFSSNQSMLIWDVSLVFLACGLLYLNFTPSERWAEQRTTFHSTPLLTIFWILSLLFVLGAPFTPNNLIPAIPFYVVPALGTSMLGIGTVYWLIWAKLLPAMGFDIQHEIVQMPDGSERVKYKVGTPSCHLGRAKTSRLTEPSAARKTAEEEAAEAETKTISLVVVTKQEEMWRNTLVNNVMRHVC